MHCAISVSVMLPSINELLDTFNRKGYIYKPGVLKFRVLPFVFCFTSCRIQHGSCPECVNYNMYSMFHVPILNSSVAISISVHVRRVSPIK
jgi:hypothetical protein